MNFEHQIHELANAIKNADKISVMTGAGISTESGIPDFRSTEGLWNKPGRINMSREELMSTSYMQRQPEHFWDFFKEIFQIKLMNDFKPNYGHVFLAELENMGKDVSIITQNVDGLHSDAGSSKVYEAHGTINTASCTKCHHEYDLDFVMAHDFPQCNQVIKKENVCNAYIVVNDFFSNHNFVKCDDCGEKTPIDNDTKHVRCKHKKKSEHNCNGYLRPGVVLFGDGIKHYDEAVKAVENSDLFIAIGTSLKVWPINQLAHTAAKTRKNDRKRFLINNDTTEMDYLFDGIINAGIGDTFEKVSKILKEGS